MLVSDVVACPGADTCNLAVTQSRGLAAAIGEDAGTLEDVYEPYLLQNNLLSRTPRGRMATPLAYEHLGKTPPATPASAQEETEQTTLF